MKLRGGNYSTVIIAYWNYFKAISLEGPDRSSNVSQNNLRKIARTFVSIKNHNPKQTRLQIVLQLPVHE